MMDAFELEELVEMLFVAAHRSEVAFVDQCEREEYVAHEVMLLRALFRMGENAKGRDLARTLGWSAGRVSQVIGGLVAKGHVTRGPRLSISITERGIGEMDSGSYVLRHVGEPLVAGIGAAERDPFVGALRRISKNSEALWRIRRFGFG